MFFRFRSLRLPGLLLFLGISTACTSPQPATPLKVEVEYGGCEAVLVPGPVCVLGPGREIQLWIGAPLEARIEIRAAGERIDAAGEPVQEGRRFAVKIPSGAREVSVRVEAPDGTSAWSLALEDRQIRRATTSHDVLREVNGKATLVYNDILARRLAAARETLDGILLPAEAPAESRCLVHYHRALLAEREGDYRSALAEIQQAVEIAERFKMDRYQWGAEQEQALLLRGVGRSRESAEIFERLRRKQPRTADSCDTGDLLNNQAWSALLAREAGEAVEDPTHLLEKALETYETCERFTSEDRVNRLLNLAMAHLQEGRLAEARDLLDQAHQLESHPPLSLALWSLDLKARVALGEGRSAAALALFDSLDELAANAGSPDGTLRAAFGRARSQTALANPAAALETLSKAEALLDEQSLRIPTYEGRETFVATRQGIVGLHLQILLHQSRKSDALEVARHARSRVLRQLARADRLASLPPDRRDRWARLLMEYQERRAALEERERNDWTLSLDQRSQDRAARRAEAEALKGLLDEAFRILEDGGERPPEVRASPQPGDLLLAYHPLPQGWAGFAADGKTVEVSRFELPPALLSQPEAGARELSRRLLLPFENLIERAKRIRILPAGPLEEIDFHALPFGGDVLLASRPVVYGLDLPVSAEPARPPGRHALLVADPREDLPGSLIEARAVVQVLESGPRPWTIQELKNADASAAAVRNRLATADLLHYAGHGSFSGFGGWESSLLLAGETRLTLGDFLALDRVPAWVVLSGCDTGRTSAESPVEGLGLAHAFLLAGSRAVVASSGLADDRQVPWFFAELYRQWEREPDLAVALQRAQLAWRQRNPAADWAGFRLFEP